MLVKPRFNIPRKDVIGIWQKRKMSFKKKIIIIMNIENKQTNIPFPPNKNNNNNNNNEHRKQTNKQENFL